jgi:hypothetical protein
MRNSIRNIITPCLIVTVFALLNYCGKGKIKQPSEDILARIGDRSITVDEFIRRAEYTIRPDYAKMNTYIQKKIILNTLIAEKLFALETGEDNMVNKDEEFQAYIRGRKEQSMRQYMFVNEAYDKVSVPDQDIARAYKYAGRRYQINYFSVDNEKKAQQIADKLKNGHEDLKEIYREMGGMEALPSREVEWDKEDNEVIHQALFSDSMHVGQIVGPLKIDDDFFMTIEIAGWRDRLAVSESQIAQRWDSVEKRLKSREALKVYEQIVAGIMKGKRLEFNEDTFYSMARVLAPFYLRTPQEIRDAFNKRIWQGEEYDLGLDKSIREFDEMKDEPLLTIDGEVWTIDRFRKEMISHPLIFRKREMKNSEFPAQLRLAIADLIRDIYITKEAYKKGYDQVNIVQRNANMWKDYVNALYQRKAYLDKIGVKENFAKNYMKIINTYLNSYVDSLQSKYSNVIEIDTDKFEKIELTRIDLFVVQKNMPFPIVVPSFPLLTTDNKLDYGKKVKFE